MARCSDSQLTKELQYQLAVTQTMLMNQDLDPILYGILTCIIHSEGVGLDRAFLFLASPDGKELHAATALGPSTVAEAKRAGKRRASERLSESFLLESFETALKNPPARPLGSRLAGFTIPLSPSSVPPLDEREDVLLQALIARCAALREPFTSKTIRAIYQPPPAGGGEALTFTHLAMVPLVKNETVLGVILADNYYKKRPLSAKQRSRLSVLGNLAAIALDRSRLEQRYKEMLSLDGLTGVLNRRHFELRLTQEMARASIGGRSLSLLLLDIDRFGECNSRYGHERGDLVLKELAALLRERVRSEDLVARFGGEKFVILLTGGVTIEESGTIAEKLRSHIAAQAFGGCSTGEVTVSIGVSWLPSEKLDAARLFRQAEDVLVRAQRNGCNQVAVVNH